MDNWEPTLTVGPLLGIAATAIALILFLVIYLRLHAFVTLVIVSVLTAIAAGIPLAEVPSTLSAGFGSTLASVALLVGLGAMIGRLVEHSGGAVSLASALVGRFGENRAPFALGVASLIMGFPIFFDAGLIVMLPVIFAVARRLGGPVLTYGIPAACAFSVMHIYLPPHPGPVAASEFFGADIGLILLFGLLVALPTWYISGYWWGIHLGQKYSFTVSDVLLGPMKEEQVTGKPVAPGTVIAIMLIPMLLIFGNTGLSTLASAGVVEREAAWVQLLIFLGQTSVALLITTVVAMVVMGLRRGMEKASVESLMDGALGPICSVVLITGAGGMFGGVLRTSGIGDALASSMSAAGIPVVLACYLVSAVLRVAQGSATVALTTAAALMAPAVEVAGYNAGQLALIVLATAAGSVFASHVNDSGFWLVGRLMGMDVATTLRTWTMNQVLVSAVGFVLVMVLFGVVSALG